MATHSRRTRSLRAADPLQREFARLLDAALDARQRRSVDPLQREFNALLRQALEQQSRAREQARARDPLQREFNALLRQALEQQSRAREQARARKRRQRAQAAPVAQEPSQRGRPAKVTVSAALKNLLDIEEAPHTVQSLAARLGVSERSLRRWKNEGKTPANPDVIRRINAEQKNLKKLQKRKELRQAVEGLSDQAPIRIQGKRKWLWRDGGWNLSHTVTYDLEGLSRDEQMRVIMDLWRPEQIFRLYAVVDIRRTYEGREIRSEYGLKTLAPVILIEVEDFEDYVNSLSSANNRHAYVLKRVRLNPWEFSPDGWQYAMRHKKALIASGLKSVVDLAQRKLSENPPQSKRKSHGKFDGRKGQGRKR